MANPFPGMDPFLEHAAYWLDFHSRFINYWCEAIADALPPLYEASLGERVYLLEPDVTVTHAEDPAEALFGGSSQVTLQPATLPLTMLDGPRETYIEILYQPDRSLVAALELLSPANKEQPGRTEYLAKRRAFLYQKVHLVELDLLVGGRRLPMEKPLPRGDYHYFLSRAEQRPDCQVYSWGLRQPLPTLPVPLRPPDADIPIDLGAVFTTAYERGRFQRRINYHGSLPSFLGEDDKRWAQALLEKK